MMQLKAVEVRFGHVAALSGVNLCLAAGDRLALVGANGSGKSTLLRVLHALVPTSAGELVRQGAPHQGMVFQRPYMLRTTALNNVAVGLWIAGVPWSESKVRAMAALERVGLQEVRHRSARALSSGQQQRLALARAWSLRPELLLLDEPTSSLDPHAKREVEALMGEFARDGMTLVFASHNLGQVKRLATRVVYLEHGRVLADLPVRDFFDRQRLAQASPEADLFVKGELA